MIENLSALRILPSITDETVKCQREKKQKRQFFSFSNF